jgi:exodeoxyribonuclease V alpha subunit
MNKQEQIYKFKGKIIRSVYKSEWFSVYALDVDKTKYPLIKLNKYGNAGICGDLFDLITGVEYEIEAIEEDTKYGISYKVLKIRRDEPTTKEETYAFLREILTCNQSDTLIDAYPDIISMVKEDRLNEVDISKLKGIGEKSFEKIKCKIVENFYLMDLVSEFGGILSLSMLKKIYDAESSVEMLKIKLKTKPYTTLTRISGVGFKKADAIVIQLQKENKIDFGYDVKTSSDRCLACVLYLLGENENEGNTKANLVDIRSEVIKLTPECAEHFVEAIRDRNIYYNKETMCVALQRTYDNEKYIADSIKYGLSINRKWNFDWKQYQNKGKFNLSDEQIELLHSICENNVVILTGGAGMGKSASTGMLIEMLEDNNKAIVLATPTGKSAKVLKDFSKREAKTIHRVLCFNPQTGWGYNKECKIDCDVFLIDEFSMVSVELMTHVIDAIDFSKTKLVMIGDPNQLPSLQCGNLLFDFMASKLVPIVRLTKVFRYGTGGILTSATDIVNGRKYIPDGNDKVVSIGNDDGYTFIKSDDKSIIKETVALYKKLITVGVDEHIYKPEEIVVLTAYNKGDYGSIMLNKYLQKIANKNYGSEYNMKYGDNVYYLNDIVMQKVNDYSMPIFDSDDEAFVANGECSKISLIDKDYMVCDFDDIQVQYNKDKLQNLSLSYSYSIHKSQGSTVKIAIVVSPRSHIYMLSSNLLYTAVTRASDKCFHFGLPSTINMVIKKKENFNRKTFMLGLLCGEDVCK